MSLFRRAVLALSLAAPLALASAPSFAQDKDIVDTAAANKEFSTLVSAIKAAGLAETLKGKGPFTVFAPTDEAFKKLSPGALEYLLKPENKATLAGLLNYHVLAGSYDSARITKPATKKFAIKSVQGQNLNVDITKGVVVAGATVTKADTKASNGLIHTVDTVLVPRKVKLALATFIAKEKAAAAAAKAKELAGKAAEATKEAAKKAGEATKAAIEKAKEATKPAAPATPEPKKN